MSNFEKIQSDELAECQDYQDWIDYQQDEAMQVMDSDLDYQLDELNAELEDFAAHQTRFMEIFGVTHEIEPRTDEPVSL
jgi:hypothetical protein